MRHKVREFWPITVLPSSFLSKFENNRLLKKKINKKYGKNFRSSRQCARFLYSMIFNKNYVNIVVENQMDIANNTIFYQEILFENKI